MSWQPIETAPKDRLIDIWIPDAGGGVRWTDCYYDTICDEWRQIEPGRTMKWVSACAVTHWRLPPEPPK